MIGAGNTKVVEASPGLEANLYLKLGWSAGSVAVIIAPWVAPNWYCFPSQIAKLGEIEPPDSKIVGIKGGFPGGVALLLMSHSIEKNMVTAVETGINCNRLTLRTNINNREDSFFIWSQPPGLPYPT